MEAQTHSTKNGEEEGK